MGVIQGLLALLGRIMANGAGPWSLDASAAAKRAAGDPDAD
jgi:hypothetical protein